MNARGYLESVGVLCLLVLLWWITAYQGWVSRAFLPTPQAVAQSLVEGLGSGELANAGVATIQRMLLGWGLACLLGIALGALIGTSSAARAWIQPTLEFIRPLPGAAVLPLAISIFGLSATMVLVVVSFASMWPVLLSTLHGFAALHNRLREVAAALQISRPAFVWKLGLPNAVPDILAGMRLSMTVALIAAVVSEMISSQFGLGQTILMAARTFRAGELFAGIVLLGAIGFASNALLAIVERRLLRWRNR